MTRFIVSRHLPRVASAVIHRHICITVCHMDRRFREAADRLSPERERKKQLVRIDDAPGF